MDSQASSGFPIKTTGEASCGTRRAGVWRCVLGMLAVTFLGTQAHAQYLQPVKFGGGDGGKYPAGLWGDTFVWSDYRADTPGRGMYKYDFSTGVETRFMADQQGASFRGSVLAYGSPVVGSAGAKSYNLDTGQSYDLSSQSYVYSYTALGSKYAAWSGCVQLGSYTIYAREIQADGSPTGPVLQVSTSGQGTSVATDGDYVAWGTVGVGVKLKNVTTGTLTTLGSGYYVAMQGDHVVWSDSTNNTGVWIYDIATGTTRNISSTPANETPAIWGDQIVWASGNHILGYNLATEDRFDVTAIDRPGLGTPKPFWPHIYENRVTWSQWYASSSSYGDDLYTMQIPEPASLSLLTLAGLATLVRGRRLRR
jgi:hypothetical protein